MKKIITIFAFVIVGVIIYLKYQKQEDSMNANLIPREVLFGNPERSGVSLSADGKYISYLSSLEGVQNIFIATIDNPNSPTPITSDKGRGIRRYFWSYDNKHIIYLKDDGGDENWRIHVVDISTKEDKIYSPEKVYALILHVSDKFPDEIIIGLNDRDEAYHDLYRLNLKTGEKTLILQNDEKFSEFIFDDNYKLHFVGKSTPDGGCDYFKAVVIENNTYRWESYLNIPMEDIFTTGLLGFTRDGKILYMLDSRGRDLNVLKEIDVGSGREKILAEAEKAEINNLVTSRKTGLAQAYSINYLRNEWSFLDSEFEKDISKIKETLKGEITIVSRTLYDNLWVVAELRDDGPMNYYLYDKNKKNLSFLFSNRNDLNNYKLAKMESVVIKARDSLELPSYLTRPLYTKGAVPMIVLVHGGPWARDDWGYDPEAQWFANRGYAVLQVNFRMSTGFGKSFASKGNLEWGRNMHFDILDSVQWAIDEGIADKNSIAVYGGSYGGYEALWSATNSSDVFKCAIDLVGPSNLETLLATFPAYWQSFMETAYRKVGDPRTEEGKKLLFERSPLNHVDKINIPLLIAQGEKDPRVKQSESDQIIHAMKEKKIPYIYMLFMNEGHGFAKPENRFVFYGVVERFLAENLGGRFEKLSDEIEKSTLSEDSKKELFEIFQNTK